MSKRPAMKEVKKVEPKQEEKREYAEIEEHIANARVLAERAVPSFICGIRASTVIVTPRCPSIAIDEYWRTYWNPKAVQWLIDSAKAVSASNPCSTCKATSHHPLSYIAGTWIHEVSHLVFKHKERSQEQGYTDRNKANLAADGEINDDIPGIGELSAKAAADKGQKLPALCLPSMCTVVPADYINFIMQGGAAFEKATGKQVWDIMGPQSKNPPAGMVAIPFGAFPKSMPVGPVEWMEFDDGKIMEYYYETMPVPAKPKSKKEGDEGDGQDGEGEGQDGEGQGQGQGKGKGKKGKGTSKPLEGKGKGTPQPGEAPGAEELNDHGSGVFGDERPWDEGNPAEKDGGAPGVSKSEAHAIRRDIATRIMEQAKNQGSVPAGWEVWADAQLKAPKVRWQDVIRTMSRQAINRIRGERLNTFRRLSRASIVSDCKVIKPSTYDTTPVVYIICDTSGSMGAGSNSPLERALSECEAIIKLNKVKAYFLDCDANVYGKAQDVKSLRTAKVHGGGGTDMSVGVKAAVNSKPAADFIVLLTDSYTPWPTREDLKGVKIVTAVCNTTLGDTPDYMNPILVDLDK